MKFKWFTFPAFLTFFASSNLTAKSDNFTFSDFVSHQEEIGTYLTKIDFKKQNSELVYQNNFLDQNFSLNSQKLSLKNNSSLWNEYLQIYGVSLIGTEKDASLYLNFLNVKNIFSVNNHFDNLTFNQTSNQWGNKDVVISIKDNNTLNFVIKNDVNIDVQLINNSGWTQNNFRSGETEYITNLLINFKNSSTNQTVQDNLNIDEHFFYNKNTNKFIETGQSSAKNNDFNNTFLIDTKADNYVKTYDQIADLNYMYVKYLQSLSKWEQAIAIILVCSLLGISINLITLRILHNKLILQANWQKQKLIFVNQNNKIISSEIQLNKKINHD